uniref:Cytochrome P450 3A24 n=1 Tax=Aceria tosichella TaxID=561515 RepID=A0A6G1S3M1_9ACAR
MDISPWISIPLATLTALIIAMHYYYKNAFKFWKKRGLRGPKPYPLVGNFLHLIMDTDATKVWAQEFGKVYGIYDGSRPILIVSDPRVMHQICVRDFNKFPNHNSPEFNSDLAKAFISSAKDDHWRRVRAILSPTFTSGKMRRMFKLLDISADNLTEALQEQLKSKPIVNLKDLFGLYTMDAIASCCYGIRLMSYKGETSLASASNRDEFVKQAMKLFEFKTWQIILLVILSPNFLKRYGIRLVAGDREMAFAKRVEQIIEKRRESGRHFDDYLQTLIEAKVETPTNNSQSDENGLDTLEQHHIGASERQELISDEVRKLGDDDNKILSDIEILSGATFLLVVGLETTSTLLTSCFYVLSFHQTIQEKLYQTIKSLARIDEQNKVSFDYDSLTSCQYLDAVVSETLRAMCPLFLNDRVASDNYYLESHDLSLPKGTKILLPLYAMMNDPDYWPDPDVFDPERFMPEQQHKIVPNSYCPFGIGPRHCLGMRFSLTESKLALAKLLMEFKFEPAPGASYPPEMKLNFALGSIKRPEVIVIRRQI